MKHCPGVTLDRQATITLSLAQTVNIPNIKVRHQNLVGGRGRKYTSDLPDPSPTPMHGLTVIQSLWNGMVPLYLA